MQSYRQTTRLEVGSHLLEAWHRRPGALTRLTPPWERVRLVEEPSSIRDGTRAVLRVRAGPLWRTWVAEHRDCRPGESFADLQIRGPFAHWRHVHEFRSVGDETSELVDRVEYRLPLGWIGKLVGSRIVAGKLERMFRYRHAVTQADLERMRPAPEPASILVTGATGMVGSALCGYLSTQGHRVRRLTRYPRSDEDLRWDPSRGELDLSPDQRIDGVVHLAGENIAGGRWTENRRQRILESRCRGTRLLSETLARRDQRPSALVSASGVNFYASDPDRTHDESSARGEGFLSEVCEAWEAATEPAAAAGIRVARLRLGVVLSPSGGALAKMLPAFGLGLAGPIGGGTQRMSWIGLDDAIEIMHRALIDERYAGPVNAVAPQIVTQREFTRTLASILRRPARLPLPALAIELALGEMGRSTLLADLAVRPGRLIELGYPFRQATLDAALRHCLGR